jgi:hypothetical protein
VSVRLLGNPSPAEHPHICSPLQVTVVLQRVKLFLARVQARVPQARGLALFNDKKTTMGRDRGEAPMEPPVRLRLARSSAPKHRGFTVVSRCGVRSTRSRCPYGVGVGTVSVKSYSGGGVLSCVSRVACTQSAGVWQAAARCFELKTESAFGCSVQVPAHIRKRGRCERGHGAVEKEGAERTGGSVSVHPLLSG